IPPSPIKPSKRSLAFIAPVGWALYKRGRDSANGPIKFDLSFTFGQASKQTPQVMHLDNSYAHCCFFSGMRGPGPISYVPSIGIDDLIWFKEGNMRSRSTIKSRTTGNVDIRSKRMGCSNSSTSVAQDCRAVPLITIEQAPHTSSRQLISH